MRNIILFLLAFNVLGNFNQGDAIKAFFWFKSNEDSLKHGCYGYLQVDSVTIESEKYCFSTFWLTYEWWFLRFSGDYAQTQITFNSSKPSCISQCSEHFSNVNWFSGFKLDDSSDSIRFYFPLQPQLSEYGRYDYFVVDIDSLLDLQFYGAGDNIMVGTFVHKKPDSLGAVNILGRNAFIIELTNSNSLRISSIRCDGEYDSLISLYLKFSLDSLKRDMDWYGIDILEIPESIPKIRVHSIDLEGTPPYLIGSNKNIIWKLDNKEEIDSCSVKISYDQVTWESLGTTLIDTTFSWIVDPEVTQETIIKIIACGKHGEYIFATRSNIPFFTMTLKSLQIIK